MDDVRALFQRVNMADYPDYAALDGVSDRPGMLTCEHHMFRFIRVVVSTGYLFSTLHFYLYRYPRTPFADRPLLYLHHYFFPSAGWCTPMGAAMGWCYGAYTESRMVAHSTVCAAAACERAAAMSAYAQQQKQQQQDSSGTSLSSFLSRSLFWCWSLRGLLTSPLSRSRDCVCGTNMKEQLPQWAPFLPRYGLLWVYYHSTITDPSWYEQPSSMHEMCDTPDGCAPCCSSSLMDSTAANSPATASRPTKAQSDWLVSRALGLRHSTESMRWHDTASRCSFLGIITMLLAWNSKNMFFRASMGMGAGVVAGSLISALRLDQLTVQP